MTVGGPWTAVLFFCLDKLCETLIFHTWLLYGVCHIKRDKERFYGPYILYSIIWGLFVAFSCFPLWLESVISDPGRVLMYLPVTIAINIAQGVLLWIAFHFMYMDKRVTTRRETFVHLGIFLGSGLVSWTCSYFL